ncbi:MAG: hypothetical protein AVDCRST_MAG93-6450 [uncultured Chloroflexia bacterium]|uniref:Uncharacterized protein n=1 Tax=uncultured Chloroflexia bacterium TaxID=1672391 RepID=A0A6J4LP06_9CHLR|nr:MAG: hypothetical protein AVDCRST_MAG93-6450 [uncultured Chloroflexia bacterium]
MPLPAPQLCLHGPPHHHEQHIDREYGNGSHELQERDVDRFLTNPFFDCPANRVMYTAGVLSLKEQP